MNSFLKSLEDPERPFLGPNYWLLKKAGLLLPQNKLGRITYIIIHQIVVFFILTQYMELYVIRSDMNLVLTNMKISLLSVICITKVQSYMFWQKDYHELLDYVTEADNFERQSNDPVKRKIIETYTRYSRRLTYFYWFLVFTTISTAVFSPLLTYLTSSTFRENFRNGTEPFPHIMSAWVPFDKYHSPGSWVTVIWHICTSSYGGLTMAAYDTCGMVIMVFFGGKLDLLRERCKEMFGSDGAEMSDQEFKEVVRQLHGIHVTMLKYSRLFNSLLSPVMFFYVVVCSLMLCVSAYQMTSAQSTAQKIVMVQYLTFGIAQLFFFCWHSNDVLMKNEKMLTGPFESQWYMATNKQKRDVLTLLGQLCIKTRFTAGPFADLTLPTFINIMKGAYSYYTLLRE